MLNVRFDSGRVLDTRISWTRKFYHVMHGDQVIYLLQLTETEPNLTLLTKYIGSCCINNLRAFHSLQNSICMPRTRSLFSIDLISLRTRFNNWHNSLLRPHNMAYWNDGEMFLPISKYIIYKRTQWSAKSRIWIWNWAFNSSVSIISE